MPIVRTTFDSRSGKNVARLSPGSLRSSRRRARRLARRRWVLPAIDEFDFVVRALKKLRAEGVDRGLRAEQEDLMSRFQRFVGDFVLLGDERAIGLAGVLLARDLPAARLLRRGRIGVRVSKSPAARATA